MKTKKTNQESTNSTQKNVEQKSYNWQNGANSSIGAAIGVAAGSMAQTAFATEPVTEGPVQPPHTDTPTVTSEVPLTNEPIAPQKPDTPATPIMPGNSNDEPHNEDTISVVSYETVTCEDGSQMDIAGVIVNGQETLVVDIDRDGIADAMVADMDNNGIITDNEVINIEEAGIRMEGLSMATTQATGVNEDATLLADNDPIPDYINDADVTGYMA